MKFDDLYIRLMKEAKEEAPPPPSDEEAPDVGGGDDPNLGDEDIDIDSIPDVGEEDDPVNPEEIELAKLAVRAVYFNLDSKSIHQYKLKVKDDVIPFEKIPDFFEETKQWKPVIAFIEHIMDRFEGNSSRWAEDREISGKPIIDKIRIMNRNIPEEEQLDDAKRLYWARIILNCILFGKPSENMNIGDVTERNLKEIFGWLKLHYGTDTRGIIAGKDHQASGVF